MGKASNQGDGVIACTGASLLAAGTLSICALSVCGVAACGLVHAWRGEGPCRGLVFAEVTYGSKWSSKQDQGSIS